jgi:hypothetical protein
VARHGWRLLPHYRFEPASGRWQHIAGRPEAPLSLHEIDYTAAGMAYPAHRRREPEASLVGYLAEARRLLAHPPAPTQPPQSEADLAMGADFEALRWFLMPDEAAAELAGGAGSATQGRSALGGRQPV